MADATNVVELLRVEGIMAQGFGISPKIVMRDRRLSIEAKSIYCYLAAYAGGGNQSFPSRDTILADLNISKNRYYKHFKQLVDCDYIRIERTKAIGNLFNRNIYTIVAAPAPEAATNEEKIRPERIVVPASTTKGAKVKSANNSKEHRKPDGTELTKETSARLSAEDLAAQLQVTTLIQQYPDDEALIAEMMLAVEDIALSDQIAIGKTIKPKAAINAFLAKLTVDHIRLVLETMRKNKRTLINRKAYIQTCLFNSIFDINNHDQIKKTTKDKDLEEKKEKREAEATEKELYRKHPQLKELDREIGKVCADMSRAILQGNEMEHRKLREHKALLEARRIGMIEENYVDVSVLKTSDNMLEFQ